LFYSTIYLPVSICFTGDPDENMYVVQSGLLNVFITDSNGASIPLKQVTAGDSVTSLLSLTDVLMVNLLIEYNRKIILFHKKSFV